MIERLLSIFWCSMQTAKALVRMSKCTCSSEPWLLKTKWFSNFLFYYIFEIVQTHMLSRAFADHTRHKYQQSLYQLIWGSAQDDFMLGSELCSRKEHMHRMIEVRSVSHAAWAYCRTGKSFKILKREGRGCQSDNLRITHISA